MERIKYIKPSDNTKSSGLNMKNIVYAAVIAVIIGIAFFLLSAIIFTYTNLKFEYVTFAVNIALYLSAFLSGIFSAIKTRNNGWISGGITGLIYSSMFLILSMLMLNKYSVSPVFLFKILLSVLCGCIGGIVGVNIKLSKHK